MPLQKKFVLYQKLDSPSKTLKTLIRIHCKHLDTVCWSMMQREPDWKTVEDCSKIWIKTNLVTKVLSMQFPLQSCQWTKLYCNFFSQIENVQQQNCPQLPILAQGYNSIWLSSIVDFFGDQALFQATCVAVFLTSLAFCYSRSEITTVVLLFIFMSLGLNLFFNSICFWIR